MVHKFGRNGGVANGAWEFVNLLGMTGWPLSAASTVRIKAGGNVNDTAAGTGARAITVQGIDDSFNEVTEEIVTAGASASSATGTSYWRIHRAYVADENAGTYGGTNTGVVTIEKSAGGTDIISIGADKGQTQYAGWTVPIGKAAYLLGMHFQVDTNKSALFRVYTRAKMDVVTPPVEPKRLRLFFAVTGQYNYQPKGPELALPAKSDFWVEAWGDGANCAVTVNFELLVVDD